MSQLDYRHEWKIELNCEIRLKSDNTDFINALTDMVGVQSAVLVSYNGDYLGSSDVMLQYTDDDPDSYFNIFDSAKTEVSTADQTRLIESLKTLSEFDASAVDVESVIRYFAVHNFVVNGDGTRPIIDWIYASEEYTELYHDCFSEFLEQFDLTAMIGETAALIAPYTDAGQAADSTALIDASGIVISDMGSMNVDGKMGGANDPGQMAGAHKTVHGRKSAPRYTCWCIERASLSLWERWPSAVRTERENNDLTIQNRRQGPLSHLR